MRMSGQSCKQLINSRQFQLLCRRKATQRGLRTTTRVSRERYTAEATRNKDLLTWLEGIALRQRCEQRSRLHPQDLLLARSWEGEENVRGACAYSSWVSGACRRDWVTEVRIGRDQHVRAITADWNRSHNTQHLRIESYKMWGKLKLKWET